MCRQLGHVGCRMAARTIKATVGWVTTKMNKSLLRGRKSGTSELRAETELQRADEPRFTSLPPLLLLPSSSNLT